MKWYADWEREKEEREERAFREPVEKAIEENKLVVTKRGVFKNLEMSPYEVQVKDRTLKFSSRAKMNKFCDEMKRKETQLFRSFQRIYGEDFDKEETNFNALVRSLYITKYNKLKLK
jgi:phenylalanyl-tRNA synthetase alpha subunit